jgi:hypothetical protein
MTELLPTRQAADLRRAVIDYVTTAISLADPSVASALDAFLTEERSGIFLGPYLRTRLPFAGGNDGAAARELVPSLPDEVRALRPPGRCLHPPHHQPAGAGGEDEAGFRLPQPTIVTTGTGSGKTESFLYPVLDHAARAKKAGIGGIKALILYPMNALANDQAGRLAKLITDTPAYEGLTAALYTGEASHEPSTVVTADPHHRPRDDPRQRPGRAADELQDARPAAAAPRRPAPLGSLRRLAALPGARRVPHLRRRAGHRRGHAAAPPAPRARPDRARPRAPHPGRHLRHPRRRGRRRHRDARLRPHRLRHRHRRGRRDHRDPRGPRGVRTPLSRARSRPRRLCGGGGALAQPRAVPCRGLDGHRRRPPSRTRHPAGRRRSHQGRPGRALDRRRRGAREHHRRAAWPHPARPPARPPPRRPDPPRDVPRHRAARARRDRAPVGDPAAYRRGLHHRPARRALPRARPRGTHPATPSRTSKRTCGCARSPAWTGL